MASTSSSTQVYHRPSRLIDNHQKTFIPRRMPVSSRKTDQLGTKTNSVSNQDTSKSPPIPPRGEEKDSKEFPPRGGVSNLLRSTGNSNSKVSESRLRQPKSYGFVSRAGEKSSVSSLTRRFSDKKNAKEDIPPKLPPRGSPPKTTEIVSASVAPQIRTPTPPGQRHNSNDQIGLVTPPTPEPQPLTRTNVTKHDIIWTVDKEEDSGLGDILSPPLKHITPETTAEMIQKFDPTLDVLESCSDSSADTMIMMTTEEEKRNEERIVNSTKEYQTQRKNHVTFRDFSNNDDAALSSTTVSDNKNVINKPRVAFIPPKPQLVEDDISVDDGYGTNSSSGTNVSSPLSSSSSSSTEVENSSNPITLKSALKNSTSSNQNGPVIKPMISTSQPQVSTRNTWAVRRRTKMMESQDNTLQEQLRQLAIIEEEDNARDNTRGEQVTSFRHRPGSGRDPSVTDSQAHQKIPGNPQEPKDAPTRDLRKFEGELCDKFTDMDRNYRNYYDFDKNSSFSAGDDSKVLYFQHKMMKQNYGNDNYYNPHMQQYGSLPRHRDTSAMQPFHNAVPTLGLSKNMVSMPSLCPGSARSDYSVGYSNGPREAMQTWPHHPAGADTGLSVRDQTNDRLMANTSYDNFFPNDGDPTLGMPHKGRFVSVDNIHQNGKRPVFASSADIYDLFQSNNNLASQLQHPACYRHSFHAVPTSTFISESSQNKAESTGIRPRASSTSVAMQSKSSWNPFGGMFGKKKSKNSQQKSESGTSDPKSDHSQKNGNSAPLKTSGSLKQKMLSVKTKSKEPTKPLPPKPTHGKNPMTLSKPTSLENHVTPNANHVTANSNHVTKQYTVVPIIRTPRAMQMRTHPQGEQERLAQSMPVPTGMYESRFKTVTVDEGNSQKLSTLV